MTRDSARGGAVRGGTKTALTGKVGVAAALVALAAATPAALMIGASGASALNVKCSNQDFHTLKMEMNLRASEILVHCGKLPGGASGQGGGGALGVASPFDLGGSDANVI